MKTAKDFTEAQLLAMKIRAAENLKKAGFPKPKPEKK